MGRSTARRPGVRWLGVLLVAALPGCGLKADPAPERLLVQEAPSASPGETASAVPSPAGTAARPVPSPSAAPPAASPAPAPEAPPPATRAPSPTPAPEVPRTAAALVGRWHVDGPGVPDGTALVLGEDLVLFLACGAVDGAWEADGPQGLFIASTYGGDSSCFTDGPPRLNWLEAARGFDVDGEQRVLQDVTGRALVRLRPGARPTTGPNRTSDDAAEPQVTDRMRAGWVDPAPLPAEARPVTPQQLQRRWVPVEQRRAPAHLEFRADGDYRGSDGCNGAGGRYVLGGQGRLLATGGPSTAVGCDGTPVGSWADGAARAGLVDGDLVLYGPRAEVLGRLRAG